MARDSGVKEASFFFPTQCTVLVLVLVLVLVQVLELIVCILASSRVSQ
jgi:hypothetical protein